MGLTGGNIHRNILDLICAAGYRLRKTGLRGFYSSGVKFYKGKVKTWVFWGFLGLRERLLADQMSN